CGVEKAGQTSNGEPVVLATVQSLIKRLDKFSPYDFDMLITDEAHHAAAPSYKKIYDYFKPRLHIGFTATPNRGDKVRLDDVYEEIIFEKNLRWGIENQYLSDVKCLRVSVSYDLRWVRRRMGDFVESDLDKAINTDVFNKEVAEAYKRFASGQTLIFASGVSHAENIAKYIDGAVVVSQKTKDRARIISDFTARKIKCIVNCMIFTEGTDMPLIETIIVARPTQNASLYTQMVGRGLRKYPGKRYLTLIDLVGVSEMDVCTAPTLMGLDMEDVPEGRRLEASGAMLTAMESVIEKLSDCPENWVLNVERVRLFANSFDADAHDVNWTKKADGSLVYQFSCGDRIGIKAVNELGKTKLMRYVFDEHTDRFDYFESEEMTIGQAFDRAYDVFCGEYKDEQTLWDLNYYYRWSEELATEKQVAYLKNALGAEFDRLAGERRLTKGDCSQIINMLKIRNTSPAQLVRLRKKREQELERQKEDAKRRAIMKIRYDLKKKGALYKKYYALILPDELVVTDDWQTAAQLIDAAQSSGSRVKYKSFLSLSDAQEFLRA
ncbi:MAG: DEAD/DEAH box helicase, partial [Clostridia bacterium]|nr:DEAD/DEAH box helicase [Clostridia bacterium]